MSIVTDIELLYFTRLQICDIPLIRPQVSLLLLPRPKSGLRFVFPVDQSHRIGNVNGRKMLVNFGMVEIALKEKIKWIKECFILTSMVNFSNSTHSVRHGKMLPFSGKINHLRVCVNSCQIPKDDCPHLRSK